MHHSTVAKGNTAGTRLGHTILTNACVAERSLTSWHIMLCKCTSGRALAAGCTRSSCKATPLQLLCLLLLATTASCHRHGTTGRDRHRQLQGSSPQRRPPRPGVSDSAGRQPANPTPTLRFSPPPPKASKPPPPIKQPPSPVTQPQPPPSPRSAASAGKPSPPRPPSPALRPPPPKPSQAPSSSASSPTKSPRPPPTQQKSPPPPRQFPPPPAVTPASITSTDVAMYNIVIGIQQVNPLYGFTSDSALVEAARVTMSMGINTFKFSMDPTKYKGAVTYVNGINMGSLTTTMRDIASQAPDVVKVLDTPFTNILMWAGTPATLPITSKAIQNFTWNQAAYDEVYRQTYDLTVYLLQRYSGTGRTFFLGNWEGDWGLTMLDANGKRVLKDPNAAKGCIRWLQARQSAVDQAKVDLQPVGVEVYHYYEVNLVAEALWDPTFPCAANTVLPYAPVDFISLSSYAVLGPPTKPQDTTNLVAAMNMLEQRMAKRPLTNRLNPGQPARYMRRVFIGEYGFKCGDGGFYTHDQASQRAANVARAMINWGSPIILYWQLYNNVQCNGNCGFMMVDQNGVKLPLYNWHVQYASQARQWVGTFKDISGRLPTPQEFAAKASSFVMG